MSYRFLNPAPVFFNIPGTEPVNGGSLAFYETGTTFDKTTWSDEGMTVPNENPVPLDSSGRSNTGIWLDGEYTAVLKDSLGAVIWTRDITSGFAAGATIPALELGKYLTNDGSNLLWGDVRQVPDPTGSADYILSTDGANLIWIPLDIPAPPDPEIIVGTGSFQAGVSTDATKLLIQYGSDSAPASGGVITSKSVVFTTVYTVAPKVFITNNGGTTAAGYLVDDSITTQSTTGFTVTFNGDHGIANGSGNIIGDIPFNWMAIGTKEVAP